VGGVETTTLVIAGFLVLISLVLFTVLVAMLTGGTNSHIAAGAEHFNLAITWGGLRLIEVGRPGSRS
jgi:hypothetical protein